MSRELYTLQGDGPEMPSYDNKSIREPDGSEARPIYGVIDLLRTKATYTSKHPHFQAHSQRLPRNTDKWDSL